MDHPVNATRMEHMLNVCRDLPAHFPLEELLQFLVESASNLLQSEECSILLYDPTHRCLRFMAAPREQLPTLKNLAVPIEGSIAGWVYSRARPVKLNQADGDERVFRVVDREISDKTRSLLAVPLSFRGETIGVIEAVNKQGDAHYTEEDVFFLETLAAQAAFAIQTQKSLDESRSSYEYMIEMDQMKSDWIAILSHELRGALGLILGRSSFLSETTGPEQREDIESILSAASRLKKVAEQLDNLEQFEKVAPTSQVRRIDACSLVKGVTGPFQELAASRNISLIVDVPDGVEFEGDPSKIAIALRNLVENAVTYTNEGGWVRVWAETLPGFVKFAVIDRGIGIPEEEQDKIFERFYRSRSAMRRHKGPGLGLAIARQMVELQGGEIWVESADGQGSTFSFLIPQGGD